MLHLNRWSTFHHPLLVIRLSMSFQDDGTLFYRQQLIRPALDYAVDELMNTTLRGYDISLDFEYIGTSNLSDCESVNNIVVYKTIEQVTAISITAAYTNNPPIVPAAYFGPGCLKGVEDMATWLGSLLQFSVYLVGIQNIV